MTTHSRTVGFWHRRTYQNLLYFLIGALVVAIVSYLTPRVVYQPHGIALPAVPTAIPKGLIDPSQVKLIDPQVASPQFAPIAYISVENHYDQLSDEKFQETISYAKQLTGLAGANGLVVTSAGYVPMHQTDDALLLYSVEGQAVSIPTAPIS